MLTQREVGKEKKYIAVFSPYSGEKVGEVPVCAVSAVPEVLETAGRGAGQMKEMPVEKRTEILQTASKALLEKKETFAEMLVKEAGKTIRDARKEVERAANTLRLSAEACGQVCGEVIPVGGEETGSRNAFYKRVPVGIVLAITPFNFPLNLACHKIGPALAAGNSVIIKPASKTPMSTIMLAELLVSCGFPAEALTVVCGFGSELGNALVASPCIRKISFTGSCQAGMEISRNAGIKKITMELGSAGAVVVSKNVDVKKAASKICQAGFANAGQVCISVQRVYVHKSIQEKLIQEMKRYAESVVWGNPADTNTDLGPMISEKALLRAKDRIKKTLEMGAVLVTGNASEGNVLYPTILKDAPEHSPVIQEEMFAPVITVNAYENLKEAIRMVNGTVYGLQAGILTDKIEEAMEFAEQVECGGIMINDTCNYRVDQMPYGGLKNSGLGKEGPGFAVREMTDIKMIVINTKI